MFWNRWDTRSEAEGRVPKVSRRRRYRPPVEALEDRRLLTAPTIGLISQNIAGTNSGSLGSLFPSISADGRYEVFESGSLAGTTLPAPSDLVSGLTVANDAPNIYLRDRSTNTTTCISVNMSGNTTGNDTSRDPVISTNGQFVVFVSNATDLVPIDNNINNPNHRQNVLVRNLLTNTTTLVSITTQENGPGTNSNLSDFGTSRNPSISADGRRVAYESDDVDLVANDTNGGRFLTDVFVRDLQANTTILASVNASGSDSGDGPSNNPVISADGNFVAFDSLANDLDAHFTGLAPFTNYQVYERDLRPAGTTILASANASGTDAGNETSIFPSLSSNGSMIAFQSSATDLVSTPDANSNSPDIFVRNRAQSTATLVSVNNSGTATGDSSSFAPVISGDGHSVVFSSLANDLTTNDHDGTDFSSKDVFERNLIANTTQLISINATATNSGNNTSDMPNQTFVNSIQQSSGTVSLDGRYVLFISRATDIVTGFVKQNDPTFGYDLYLRDSLAGTTTLISHQLGTTASGGNQTSGTAALTPDGHNVAFQSTASNLVDHDSNAQTDVFASPAPFVPVGPGVLQFTSPTFSVIQSEGSVIVTLSRTLGSTGAVSVQFATGNGTAKAGTDYSASSGLLNFANGQTAASFTIPILNN